MWSLSDGPAAIVLTVSVFALFALAWTINPESRVARWCQNTLWFGALNVAAVALIYGSFAWLPVGFAVDARGWLKLVDGLAAFGVAGAMIGLHRAIKR